MWRGIDVKRLFGTDPEELIQLSGAHLATGLAIGVDATRLWAVLKIRCGIRDETLWLPHEASLQIANACISVSRDCGWEYEGMTNDQPDIGRPDWNCIDFNCVGPIALGVLEDAAVLAATFLRSPETILAFRLPTSFVAFIGALLRAIFTAAR